MGYLYLLIDIGAVTVPFIFSFHPKIRFDKHFKAGFTAILSVAFVFILWDILYTKINVWGFNPEYLTQLYFFNLPIEEVLFFICIPYSCLFTYYVFRKTFKNTISINKLTKVGSIIGLLQLLIGIYFSEKLYTAAAFGLSGALLLAVSYYKKEYLYHFYISYIVLLIPFFIVNGILTGTGIEREIVWYNNNENLSIRALTIPIEDFFYGMLLILSNIAIFEYLVKKQINGKEA